MIKTRDTSKKLDLDFLGFVACSYNPSTLEEEAGGSLIQAYTLLYNKSQARMSYTKAPFLTLKQQTKNSILLR